jgi:cytochrome c553
MQDDRLFSRRNPWLLASVGLTVGLAVLSAVVGLMVLPHAQRGVSFPDLWDAICSAAGVPLSRPAATAEAPANKPSDVVVTSGMLVNPTPESIGRGATIALQCAICHGPSGMSASQFPNLAGQYASVVYKELRDFRSGARTNTVMAPFAQRMSEQDMIDVASYYASLPRQPGTGGGGDNPAPAIVVFGAPMRGIAPCGSCHGSLDSKVASPRLEGQSAAYVTAQLTSFASGARHNDISAQMRNIARAMTKEEIEAAAAYYSSRTSVGRGGG